MAEQGPRRAGDNGGQGHTNKRGGNLSREDRARGGERSARLQNRDARGHFAGRKRGDESERVSGAGRETPER